MNVLVSARDTGVICPCCGGRFAAFESHGRVPRPGARCPGCGALERHRLLFLFLGARTDFFTSELKVLHFAPEGCFHRWFKRLPNLDYTSADLMAPHAMERVDITRIPWREGTFDAVLCSHVLEHVPDDRTAMAEVLRVLKPGGWAILHVPIDRKRAETYEDDRIVTPEGRERHFGQHDHVRWYGRDFATRLEEAGFEVREEAFAAALPAEDVRRFGLRTLERIHLCVRPGEQGRDRAPGVEGERIPAPRPGQGPDPIRALPLPLPWIVGAAQEAGSDRTAARRIAATIRQAVPPGARVLVVSRGDPELVALGDRRGEHFPQSENGVYAGYHPADAEDAIAHLEALRARGAGYLAVPEPSFWWLEHYVGFREHLEREGQRICRDEDCVVYRL